MTEEDIDNVEDALYSDVMGENYNLAEWARHTIPDLISEIRKLHGVISGLNDEIESLASTISSM